jgi:hypothetical protein
LQRQHHDERLPSVLLNVNLKPSAAQAADGSLFIVHRAET